MLEYQHNQNFIYLSHTLSSETVGYGGSKNFSSEQVSSISCGCSSNNSKWSFSNHIGTHIDVPFHFSNEGKKLHEYEANFWIFSSPLLVDIPCSPGEIILKKYWCDEIPIASDLLLIRTGFEKFRNEDLYWNSNPGLSVELGEWLRKFRPNIRAIGIDLISITSYLNRPYGREAHKAFLAPQNEFSNTLVVIEDMKLAHIRSKPKFVAVIPLIVHNADGSPVTVIAQI